MNPLRQTSYLPRPILLIAIALVFSGGVVDPVSAQVIPGQVGPLRGEVISTRALISQVLQQVRRQKQAQRPAIANKPWLLEPTPLLFDANQLPAGQSDSPAGLHRSAMLVQLVNLPPPMSDFMSA